MERNKFTLRWGNGCTRVSVPRVALFRPHQFVCTYPQGGPDSPRPDIAPKESTDWLCWAGSLT
jgi:hypothetical protein